MLDINRACPTARPPSIAHGAAKPEPTTSRSLKRAPRADPGSFPCGERPIAKRADSARRDVRDIRPSVRPFRTRRPLGSGFSSTAVRGTKRAIRVPATPAARIIIDGAKKLPIVYRGRTTVALRSSRQARIPWAPPLCRRPYSYGVVLLSLGSGLHGVRRG
ncbi:hypothetical protein C8Q77DRAFT_381762 [Trametes polyzona]|nr:hypothetical protein C8Q77DRAFT_381762 [Trametes polyzona]